MASIVESKVTALGFKLPPASKPVASYVMATRVGNLIYTGAIRLLNVLPPTSLVYTPLCLTHTKKITAGHLPVTSDGTLMTGKVGSELTTEQGYEAARNVGLNLLATLKNELGGDLDKVKRIVKLTAFVNCIDSFQSQPKVVNGCSELMGSVFGEAGVHARSAVGVNALPLNVPVEIEAIVEVKE